MSFSSIAIIPFPSPMRRPSALAILHAMPKFNWLPEIFFVASMELTGGLANIPPNMAPDSMFVPMYHAWLGSWPDPPPEKRDKR